MNRGYIFIEASIILPAIIIILLITLSAMLFFMARATLELELNLKFLRGTEAETHVSYTLRLPFLGGFAVSFAERRTDADYGKHIQKWRMPRDFFGD